MTTTTARPQLSYLHDALEDLKAKHLYFRLHVLEGEQKPVCTFDGKELINLSSNNSLWQTKFRDTVNQNATRQMQSLKNHNTMPQLRKISCNRKPSRTRTDHGDFLTR